MRLKKIKERVYFFFLERAIIKKLWFEVKQERLKVVFIEFIINNM